MSNNISRTAEELTGVTLLGNQKTTYSDDYNPDVLETFDNKHPNNDYVVTFDAYEFTSKCVVGDTLIATPEHPDGIAIKNLVGTAGRVLGVDATSGKPVCRNYFDVRKTGEQVSVVKLMFNIDGVQKYVRCTPDHLVLTRTDEGTFNWINAADLALGMKLVGADTESYPEVISVIDDGLDDVYNMEVEDVHNFFGNGVVLHNCPKTGQPDFAKVTISYIPRIKMVESKSLKLYLFSFRNHGDFHEDCMNIIKNDLVKLMDPKYLEVYGDFTSRGGICIAPYINYVGDEKYEKFAEARKLEMMAHGINHVPWPRG